jgi:four helix bundle protein
MEELELFKRFVEFADWVWDTVLCWPDFAKRSIGKQFVDAADSVGANLVEGDARYSDADAIHFFRIARGSARESSYWLNRAIHRGIIEEKVGASKLEALKSATQMLNKLIAYRRSTKKREYESRDPNAIQSLR